MWARGLRPSGHLWVPPVPMPAPPAGAASRCTQRRWRSSAPRADGAFGPRPRSPSWWTLSLLLHTTRTCSSSRPRRPHRLLLQRPLRPPRHPMPVPYAEGSWQCSPRSNRSTAPDAVQGFRARSNSNLPKLKGHTLHRHPCLALSWLHPRRRTLFLPSQRLYLHLHLRLHPHQHRHSQLQATVPSAEHRLPFTLGRVRGSVPLAGLDWVQSSKVPVDLYRKPRGFSHAMGKTNERSDNHLAVRTTRIDQMLILIK